MAFDKVWVVAAVNETGALTSATTELLTKAREIGSTVEAFAFGDANAIAADLGKFGATKVYTTGDLGDSLPGVPVAAAIAAQVQSGNAPDAILFAQDYDGRDIAARLSAKLNVGVLTNVVGLSADGTSEHAVFGGTSIVKAQFTDQAPRIFVVRPKSFAPEESGGGPAEVVTVDVPDAGATNAAKIVQRHVEERTGPKLDEAAIVVSGGRGLGEADKFEMIETLAKLLKGAPGASRAIVDAGWVPYAYQVGQTGKTVKPTVYIAAGISGATQHMVGMKGAKNIIAINKDQEAPIFSIADLGIVGDVHKVLPKLIEALQGK
ncbi:MAG TPA: electron transfer flavoprotein subunit alpha/FixB family protein [Acidimicrobiales bacterium]|nr:electron transfer flavoprotein subunit alpha/FixB family protein [Acidimicrobiales bacterium]